MWIVDPETLTKSPLDRPAVTAAVRRIVAAAVEVHWLGHADAPELIFTAQAATPHLIAREMAGCGPLIGVRLIERLYGDRRAAMTALAKAAVTEAVPLCYFRLMLEQVSAAPGSWLVLLSAPDLFGALVGDALTVAAPSWLDPVLRRTRMVADLLLRLLWLVRPGKGAQPPPPQPQPWPFAMELQWPSTSDWNPARRRDCFPADRMRSRWNNFFLQDFGGLDGGEILYVHHGNRFGGQALAALAAEAGRRGSGLCSVEALAAPWRVPLRAALTILPRGLAAVGRALFRGARDGFSLRVAMQLLNHARNWEIFLCHVRPRVMLAVDDQDISHVARTMVFGRHGLCNAGLHHSTVAGAALVPGIAFVHFHQQFRYGPVMGELFAGLWDDQPHLDVGPMRSDLIRASEADEGQRQAFHAFAQGRRAVLVAPPGKDIWNLPQRQTAFFRALLDEARRHPDVLFVIRPRPAFDPAPEAMAIIAEGCGAGHFAFALDNFDTWELIAYCELVVCNFTSLIQEALQAGRPVLTFSFNQMVEDFIYHRLCPEMVCADIDTFRQRLSQALARGGQVTERTERLDDGVCRHLYGKTIPTICGELRRLAQPV